MCCVYNKSWINDREYKQEIKQEKKEEKKNPLNPDNDNLEIVAFVITFRHVTASVKFHSSDFIAIQEKQKWCYKCMREW